MSTILTRTVSIEAPLPFTDAEAEEFLAEVEQMKMIDHAIEAAVLGVVDAAKRKSKLAAAVRVSVR